MKNVLKIIGILCIVIGSGIAAFSGIAVADYIGIAIAGLGLALAIIGAWNKAEKKTWKEIVSIILFAVGGFMCGFAGLSDTILTQVITGVFGIVSLIIGLIVTKKAAS